MHLNLISNIEYLRADGKVTYPYCMSSSYSVTLRVDQLCTA